MVFIIELAFRLETYVFLRTGWNIFHFTVVMIPFAPDMGP